MVKHGTGTVAAVLVATLLFAATSWAEPTASRPAAATAVPDAQARAAFDQGLAALHAEDWVLAEGHFRRSLELVPRQSARYNLAFVLFQQGRATESLAVLEPLLASDQTAADARYRDYAQALAIRIRERSGTDSAPAPVSSPKVSRVDPAPAAPRAPTARSAKALGATPKPASDQSLALSDWAPWATMGVGGALLITGTITFLAALRADQRVEDACPTFPKCDESLQKQADDVERLGDISTVLLVSGGALVVGGIVWKVTAQPQSMMVTVTARH